MAAARIVNAPPKLRRARLPGFGWQATLIVLPVVILTGLGLASLRQDRRLAEQEARDRAGRLAQEVADRAIMPLFEVDPRSPTNPKLVAYVDLDRPGFVVDAAGEAVWPRPFAPLPAPHAFDLASLSVEARADWESARQAVSRGDFAAAAHRWEDFLADQPPTEFAADTLYRLAESMARMGDTNAALARLEELASKYPAALGESGLPLAPLALWRATELQLPLAGDAAASNRLFQIACSNLVCQPTAITPLLLQRLADQFALGTEDPARQPPGQVHGLPPTTEEATNATCLSAWWRLWETTQVSRDLLAAMQQEWRRRGLIVTNRAGQPELLASFAVAPIWVQRNRPVAASAPDSDCAGNLWLLTRFPPASPRFHGWTECEVTNVVAGIHRDLPDLPAYFAVAVTIAGRTVPPSPSGTALLAERAARFSVQPGTLEPRLSARVYLADPAALYARQRQRTWWFLAVVLAAATTAGVGLVSAHRAFRRQQHLSELKSNFVSSVSHELRAPIASVRLLAESLDRGRITDETKRRDYFRLIGQECRRLSSLIENVLDFSRIDQGRRRYEFEPTDLLALAEQTTSLMEPYASEREVKLRLDRPAHLDPPPTLDGKAIQQALVNLIDNAVKHSPAGATVEIAVTGGTADSAPPLALSVTDHGPGIPPADRERIFEPFYRRGSELRRETPGVGIGLSIVKHVAEAHGGRVRVEGEVGQGSRFVIELPRAALPLSRQT